jgi:thiamine-phosphate pyrophosphorylase
LAGWREVLEAAIAGGIQCIQVREKTMTDAALLRHSREVVEIAHACGGIVIIDDRPDIAVASGADGVHVGSDDLPVTTCREIVGSALVIGATGATPDRVAGLIDEGADYCGVGAVLASRTRPDRTIIGVKGFQQVAADPRVDPTMLVAIGGLGSASMTPLIAAGCTRVAVSEAICAAESPRRATEDIVAAVDAPLVHRQQAAHGPG